MELKLDRVPGKIADMNFPSNSGSGKASKGDNVYQVHDSLDNLNVDQIRYAPKALDG